MPLHIGFWRSWGNENDILHPPTSAPMAAKRVRETSVKLHFQEKETKYLYSAIVIQSYYGRCTSKITRRDYG